MHPWDDVIPESDKQWYRHYLQGDLSERPLRGGARPAVIVVDMTNAFVDSRWPTGCSERGEPCAAAIRQLLDVARPAGLPVFFTSGYPPNYKPTPAELGRWVGNVMGASPVMQRPETHEIYELIRPAEGEVVIYKGARPSAFFGTNLSSMLNYHNVDTAIVTGMVTSGCVRATVLDAFQYNYHVIVPEECVADRGQVPHKVNLFDMHMKYADVVPLIDVIGYLHRTSDAILPGAVVGDGVEGDRAGDVELTLR
jgi:maleamate amidohydrolase